MVNPQVQDVSFRKGSAESLLSIRDQEPQLLFVPRGQREVSEQKSLPDLREVGIDGLRDDLKEVLLRTTSALKRCDLILKGQDIGQDQDQERDLHHLQARIEAMFHQWEDVSRVIERLARREARAKKLITR